MRKVFLLLSIVSIGFISLFNHLIKPSKAQVSVSEVFDPVHLNNNPIPDLPGNKEKPLSTLKYGTPDAVRDLLTPEAQNHITDMKAALFGDYEKTPYTISADRQVWLMNRTYKESDKFKDESGTYLGACTVVDIIDAETGKVLSQSVVYQKAPQPLPDISIPYYK